MKFTLDDRISRLENLLQQRKDELFGFSKLKASEESDFVSKLYGLDSRFADLFGQYKSSKKDGSTFHVVLSAPNKKPYYGMYFIITTKGGRKDVYVTANDKANNQIDILDKLNIDKDVNKIKNFIVKNLNRVESDSNESIKLNNRLTKLENYIKRNYEDYDYEDSDLYCCIIHSTMTDEDFYFLSDDKNTLIDNFKEISKLFFDSLSENETLSEDERDDLYNKMIELCTINNIEYYRDEDVPGDVSDAELIRKISRRF